MKQGDIICVESGGQFEFAQIVYLNGTNAAITTESGRTVAGPLDERNGTINGYNVVPCTGAEPGYLRACQHFGASPNPPGKEEEEQDGERFDGLS